MSLAMTAADDTFSEDQETDLSRLAEKLIQRLGAEEAVRVCRENSWYGVLRLIQGRQNDAIHM